MKTSKNRLEKERLTIKIMINMYCKKLHGNKRNLCQSCSDLFSYAEIRLKYCTFGENKPTCANCPIHCYKPEMRGKIREIMRYTGPRMIYTHPIIGFRHLFNKFRKVADYEK